MIVTFTGTARRGHRPQPKQDHGSAAGALFTGDNNSLAREAGYPYGSPVGVGSLSNVAREKCRL